MTTLAHGVLGIKTADGTIVQVLDFGKQGESTTIFTTTVDRQSRARFDFFYREAVGTGWIYLDNIPLNRIPPARAGEPDLIIQAHRNSRGDLLLRIEDPASPQPQLFQLDARYLAGLCRQALAAPASGRSSGRQGRSPLTGSGAAQDRGEHAPPRAPAPVPEPEAQAGKARKRGKAGWIAAPLLAGALVLLVLAIRPGGLARKPDKAGPAGGKAVEAAVEKPEKSDVSDTGGGRRMQPSPPAAVQAKPEEGSTGTVVAPSVPPASASAAGEQSRGTIPAAERPPSEVIPTAGQIEEGPAPSAPIEADWLPAGAGRELYEITWGDTLWRIAERFYGDRDLYPELAESNRLSDPDYIIAGESLELPPEIKGKEKKPSAE